MNENEKLIKDLKEAFVPLFENIYERFDKIDEKFDKIDERLENIETDVRIIKLDIENYVTPVIKELNGVYQSLYKKVVKIEEITEKMGSEILAYDYIHAPK